MGFVTDLLNGISSAFGSHDPANRDVLIVLILLISVLALAVAMIKGPGRWLNAVFTKLSKLSDKMNEFSLRADDFTGRLSTSSTNLERGVNEVRHRLKAAEERIEHLENFYRSHASAPLQFQSGTDWKLRASELEEELGRVKHDDDANGSALEIDEEPVAPAAPPEITTIDRLQRAHKALASDLQQLYKQRRELEDEFYDHLRELLIEAHLGRSAAEFMVTAIENIGLSAEELSMADIRDSLAQSAASMLEHPQFPPFTAEQVGELPKVVVVVSSPGADRAAAIGRIAALFSKQSSNVLIAACDTEVTMAQERLVMWGERIAVPIVTGPEDVKPTSIAYKAVHKAQDSNCDILLVEAPGADIGETVSYENIEKVIEAISREQPRAPHEMLLVLDALDGQLALEHARQLHAQFDITGLCIHNLEQTAKAGISIAISRELGVPIRFISIGQEEEALKVFSPAEFAAALFGSLGPSASANKQHSPGPAHA